LLFRTTWRRSIQDKVDWVQIITWNDYSEGTEISPSTGIQYGFYDLTAYYIAWFKTNLRPHIVRDVIYYFHRVEPTAAVPDGTKQLHPFTLQPSYSVQNAIELLAFLKFPGVLTVEIGGRTYSKIAKSGMTSFLVPLGLGIPHFRLYRRGRLVLDLASAFEVRTSITYQDLLYRSGSSSRAVVDDLANPPVP
jgi:hypothetical protein